MTRTLWTVVAALALAASATTLAQPPQGRGGRGIGGPGGPGGPGRPGGPGPGPFALFQQLNLTDTQREQIRAIHEDGADEKPGTTLRDLQKQLQAAIFAETPDLQKIEQLKVSIASAEAAMLSRRIDTELRIAQILTAEQRARARELAAQARPRR